MFSTLLGGLLAVRLRRWLTLLMAFGAGLLLGAAFMDLLPEALLLAPSTPDAVRRVLGIVLLSFLGFLVLEAAMDEGARRWGLSQAMGRAGGALLIFHSLRDGMAIGLSYAVTHRAGYAVAAGIAAHDLGDGMNSILLTTRGRRAGKGDFAFLAADALAPLAGGLLTVYWHFSQASSVVLLAVAAGFFLRLATMDLLGEVRAAKADGRLVLVSVLLGAAVVYGANRLLGVMT